MEKRNIDFNLYLITDRKQLSLTQNLLAVVKEALKGGGKAVQMREKDLETRELLKLAYRMRELTGKYKAELFINDRLDIALTVGADGVHLTRNSIPADAVRKVVNNRLIIGVSTHSLKEAKDAEKAGADFVTLGPIYRTPSKLKYGKPLGIDTLKQVSRRVKIPVFAIGGIKNHRIEEVRHAGAFGVAMISEILCTHAVKEKTTEVINILGE